MRILLVTPGLGFGGSERLTLASAQGLSARGHETLVAYGPPVRLAELADAAGVEHLLLSESRLTARTLPKWLRALRALVRDFEPDVIYAQSMRTTAAVALAAPRTPLLTTLHGIEASEERGAALVLRASRARVTAVSESSADGVRRHRFSPSIIVVPPGVDIDVLERAAAEPPATTIPGRRPLVTCVARHFAVKGVDVLVEAWPRVLESVPAAGLVLVGGGPEHDALVARANELGIDGSIHFANRQKNPAPYFRAADVVVLPSRREGLPVVALEALALERAVVATAVGGTPDVVCEGETGWIVPPEQPEALARAISAALSDPEERARRARQGNELVLRSYSMDAMIDRIEDLCRTLTGTPAPLRQVAAGASRA